MNDAETNTCVVQLESVEIRDTTANTSEENIMDAIDRLSADDKKLLKRTWKIVGKNMKETGGRIFEMIFDQSPDTKTLFPFMKPQVSGGKADKISLDIQFHGLRFMQIIESAITYLDHIKDLEPVLDNLGRRHGRLIERTAFRTHHWATFIECTLFRFRHLIIQDSGFSSDVGKTDKAVILWRIVLKAIIKRMKMGLAQDLKNRKAHREFKINSNLQNGVEKLSLKDRQNGLCVSPLTPCLSPNSMISQKSSISSTSSCFTQQ
uniref:Globin family profile domain-containing protein n=1 Tax=Panagrolaimus sp. JU765 TaxID=591449 RepID=A0AC34QTK7_9BILA